MATASVLIASTTLVVEKDFRMYSGYFKKVR